MGTIMLTEPATMPPTQDYRLLYGLLVGVIFGSQLEFGSIATTPQMALVLGNVFAFAVSPHIKTRVKLKRVEQVTPAVKDFIFAKPAGLHYVPGQYMEWTVPAFLPDMRGNRRTFSLASSPTEKELRIGVKFYEPGSFFKKRLTNLQPGGELVVGQLAGDFQLPRLPKTPLVFIAGGIGITPFRSMVQYLVDKEQERRITLFYAVSSMKEAAYKELFAEAKKVGVKVIYIVAEGAVPTRGYQGFLTEEIIRKEVLDFNQRVFYISGPNGMVRSFKLLLRGMKVKPGSIKTDYFSGY
jgi:ferredoxin-NADP reductase